MSWAPNGKFRSENVLRCATSCELAFTQRMRSYNGDITPNVDDWLSIGFRVGLISQDSNEVYSRRLGPLRLRAGGWLRSSWDDWRTFVEPSLVCRSADVTCSSFLVFLLFIVISRFDIDGSRCHQRRVLVLPRTQELRNNGIVQASHASGWRRPHTDCPPLVRGGHGYGNTQAAAAAIFHIATAQKSLVPLNCLQLTSPVLTLPLSCEISALSGACMMSEMKCIESCGADYKNSVVVTDRYSMHRR